MKSNQVRRVVFSAELMFTMLGDGEHKSHYNVENGIPSDSILVGICQDTQFTGLVYLLVCSGSFTPIKDGDIVPELVPTITRVN